MDWDDLQLVLAISRGGTLSAASSTLKVAHTTVSRRLRNCEAALGVQLFDRLPDGLRPTAAGEDLLRVAEHVEDELLAAESRLVGRDIELHGALRVSTLDMLFMVARDAFASFIERYPKIELTVTAPMAPVSLTRREADVAIRLTDAPPEGLVGRRLGKMKFAVFAAPSLVEQIGPDGGYDDYPWIGIDERIEDRSMTEWRRHNAPHAKIVARVDDNSVLVRQMLLVGIGAFFLPVWEGKKLGLQRVSAEEVAADVWILTHRDLKHASRVRAFLDHMGTKLSAILATAE